MSVAIQRRVLVVDDDEAERAVVAEVLRSDGFHVVLAEDGEQALVVLEHDAPPSLVVLDLLMPHLNGWQVLEAMEQTVRWAEVPVIVLTAFGTRAGLPAGCHVLHKPVDSDVLLDVAASLTRSGDGRVLAS